MPPTTDPARAVRRADPTPRAARGLGAGAGLAATALAGVLVLALGCGGPAVSSRAGAAAPARAAGSDAAPAAWAEWRAARREALAGEDGWLTLVAVAFRGGERAPPEHREAGATP